MNIDGLKNHGHSLFSFDIVDIPSKDNNKLSYFFYAQLEISECIICLCDRPLLNQSTSVLTQANHSALAQANDVQYNDFELIFTYFKKDNDGKQMIKFLCDCFYFFEQPSFIFLKRKEDIAKCKKFTRENKNWQNITDYIDSCFVFKSAEDDVVWYKTSEANEGIWKA